MDIIYTIGHSNHEEQQLLHLLKKHAIDTILDVRSSPYSKRFPQFNRELLKPYLMQNSISYLFLGEPFGARQPDPVYYHQEGWLIYASYTKSLSFRAGIQKLDEVLAANRLPALLCAEKDPFDCHRAIMVSRALDLLGYSPLHILADGSIQTQSELDLRLLDKYFPHREETSIFDLIDGETSDQDRISEAYLLRNKAIAWRIETGEEE